MYIFPKKKTEKMHREKKKICKCKVNMYFFCKWSDIFHFLSLPPPFFSVAYSISWWIGDGHGASWATTPVMFSPYAHYHHHHHHHHHEVHHHELDPHCILFSIILSSHCPTPQHQTHHHITTWNNTKHTITCCTHISHFVVPICCPPNEPPFLEISPSQRLKRVMRIEPRLTNRRVPPSNAKPWYVGKWPYIQFLGISELSFF